MSVVFFIGFSVLNGCIEGGFVKYKCLVYVIFVYKRVKYICIEGLFIFYWIFNVL